MQQPHAIFNRDFDRSLKAMVRAAVKEDPKLRAKYWQILKPRLWLIGALVVMGLIAISVLAIKLRPISFPHGELTATGLVGLNLFGFTVSLGLGLGWFLTMYRPEIVEGIARLPADDEWIIRRGWKAFASLAFVSLWVCWCLLFGGLAWYADRFGDVWPWVVLFAAAQAVMMVGVSAVGGLVLPRYDYQQAVLGCVLLPAIGILAGLWIARVADSSPYTREIAESVGELLLTRWITEPFVARMMTGTFEWGRFFGGLMVGVVVFLGSFPIFRALHPLRKVGQDAEPSVPSREDPADGLANWQLDAEHEEFWRKGMFMERIARAALSRRERLAFESMSDGGMRMTVVWFWTLTVMILLGWINAQLTGIEMIRWVFAPVMLSMFALMFYFLTPIGVSVKGFQGRMIKDNPFPLLPVSGGEVLAANLKVSLVRALFGGFHVFAMIFGMPLPPTGSTSMILLVGGMTWCLLGAASLFLCNGPLLRQADALSLFRLRGWGVAILYAAVFLGPGGLLIWLVPRSPALVFAVFGAVLVSIVLFLLLSYWLWRRGAYDYRGGLLMQQGLWGSSHREMLKRLICRT